MTSLTIFFGLSPRVPLSCIYHTLASSLICYLTDVRWHGIYYFVKCIFVKYRANKHCLLIVLSSCLTSWRKSQNALTTLVFSSSSSISFSESTEKTSDLRMLEPSLRCALEWKEPNVLEPDNDPVFPSPLSKRELKKKGKLWSWRGCNESEESRRKEVAL